MYKPGLMEEDHVRAASISPTTKSITSGTFDEIVINEFVSCDIVGVVVNGKVLIKDADNITIKATKVRGGNLRVINVKNAVIMGNGVYDGGNLVAKGNAFSTLIGNVAQDGNMRVNDDTCQQQQQVYVRGNYVINGNLTVNCNETATVRGNSVTNGNITCSDNDRLDSVDNDAFGGRVNCSKSLFD
jgi:hypothetical protein